MKSTDFALLFSILFLSILFVLDYQGLLLSKAFFTKVEYNQILDRVVEDTMYNVVEEDYYNQSLSMNKEEIINRFFNLMNYGLSEGSSCNLVSMIFTEQDGFYLLKTGIFGEKRYYKEQYKIWEIQYQFQDYMRIQQRNGTISLEGTKEKIIGELKGYRQLNLTTAMKEQVNALKTYLEKASFEDNKKKIIITTLREALEQDINETTQNRTGNKTYRVSIPYIQYEEWYQTIEGVSLLTYFVGPSIGLMGEHYERFVFSGGYLRKKAL